VSAGIRDHGIFRDLAEVTGGRLHWRGPADVEPIAGPDPRCALPVAMEAPAEREADEAGTRP